MHGDAYPVMSLRLAEEVQWELDPLHFLVTLDRFTGLGHGIDQRELDAFGVRSDQQQLLERGRLDDAKRLTRVSRCS
jgi:hypothetical protein